MNELNASAINLQSEFVPLSKEALENLILLHGEAKGAVFDLVSEDSPLAKLVIALSQPGVGDALFTMATTHLRLVDVIQSDSENRHAMAKAICTAIGDDWDREGFGEGGKRLTGYDDLAIAAAEAVLRCQP